MRAGLVIASFMFVGTAIGQATGQMPAVFDGVGIEEQLGNAIPRQLPFLDESGDEVLLGSFFDGEKPVLLNMVYHECPMLCSLLLTEFTKTVAQIHDEEGWLPGQEYHVITVSFSATEQPDVAKRAKKKYIEQLGLDQAAAGWHFLTGPASSIDGLAESLGYGYKWVEESAEYAHPAALMFLSGSGMITRYLHGMRFDARDTRLGILEASEGRVGTAMDKIIMFCFRYDSNANSYVADAWNLMRAGGLLNRGSSGRQSICILAPGAARTCAPVGRASRLRRITHRQEQSWERTEQYGFPRRRRPSPLRLTPCSTSSTGPASSFLRVF